VPKIKSELADGITRDGSKTISEIWLHIKNYIIEFDFPSKEYIKDYGIMAEVFTNSDEYSKPQLYFCIQYRLNYEEDGEEYEYSEMVYCDFDLSNYSELDLLKNECLDLWGGEFPLDSIFSQVEEWQIFKMFKDQTLPLRIHGSGV
jgi:hypothetical protein